mgnify:FL=1
MDKIMYDQNLAKKFLIKIGKDIVNAMSTDEEEARRKHLQTALSELEFMHDVLHLDDGELQVIPTGR